VLIHTGEYASSLLNDIIIEDMELRQPDYRLSATGTRIGVQLSAMFRNIESILEQERPNLVLVLGDSNTALCAILAERMGIRVAHLGAGNRSCDRKCPEEKNRRVIEASSSIHMAYTPSSKANLLREGCPAERIVLTGNPIREVMLHVGGRIAASDVLQRLELELGQYIVVTAHHAENVDDPDRLDGMLDGLNRVAEQFGKRLIFSAHPYMRSKLLHGGIKRPMHALVEFHDPFGFHDFVRLEQSALCAITDSGAVQEECCLLGVPTVTIRRATDRPETVDCGSNVVCGPVPERIVGAVKLMSTLPANWRVPEGYDAKDASDKVVKILLSQPPFQ
jgi:UDP-N-acetylglucosamine 2-epimerase (non-hydrolysing)